MISYNNSFSGETISVLLDEKIVGTIHRIIDGYQYFPKGKKTSGEIFPTIKQVKESLEG